MFTSSRMIFDTRESVRDRLVHTFIFYRNKFYSVANVGEKVGEDDFYITLADFYGNASVVRVNDPEVVFQGLPLGFINSNKGPFFVSRTGHRQYKQGIHDQNISINPILETQRRLGFDEYFYDCLAKTVLNDFPPLQTYIESGKGGAFSRYFAKVRDEIYYKTNPVGKIVDNKPVLNDKYKYLQESLNEALHGTAT